MAIREAEDGTESGRTAAPPQGQERPVLADDVELIGEYEDSGYKEAPQIAKRSDGQVVQLSKLLYAVAQRCDGQHDSAQIADEVAKEIGKDVSADNIDYLVREKLRPLGVLKLADGSEPKLERVNPFLALKFRTALVPKGFVRAVTALFYFLYFPPVQLAALGAFAAFDIWLFFMHGVGAGIHDIVYKPALLLIIFGLLVGATAFHEFGHATACRYGGAEPGVIGFGIYLVWPAFYTDVTDSYRLSRWGRLRVDLGGIYFNAVFILIEAGLYVVTGFEPLLIAIAVQHIEMIHQFLPFVRLDGYYVVSDITGVPDLFSRIKPILKSFIPGRRKPPEVAELKRRVRFIVTGWVVVVVPILAFNLGMILFHLPRILGTAWDSAGKQVATVSKAMSAGGYLLAGVSAFQLLVLGLPMFGILYLFTKLGKQVSVAAWKHSEGHPALRSAYSVTGTAFLALLAFVWWPNGDYRPIARNERWTLDAGVASFRGVARGNPGLAPADPHTPRLGLSKNPPFDLAPPHPSSRPSTGTRPVPSDETTATPDVRGGEPTPTPLPTLTPSASETPNPTATP